jgi:hypothetical protein
MAEPATKPSENDPPTPEPPSVVREVEGGGAADGTEDHAWFDGMTAMLAELPPMTEEERKRHALLGRLACALEVMSDEGADRAIIEQAIGWRLRDDFEQLLDAWEATHPARATP